MRPLRSDLLRALRRWSVAWLRSIAALLASRHRGLLTAAGGGPTMMAEGYIDILQDSGSAQPRAAGRVGLP